MKVLVISPHPDDETLGCGGTIIRHKDIGDNIFWLIVTNIDEKDDWEREVVEKRQKEIKEVSKSYGFKKIFQLNFPAAKLDIIPFQNIIKSISKVILEVKPEIIYLPNRSDIHTDHQITFKAAYSCTKNFRYPFIKKLLMYETLSETEFSLPFPESAFIPNAFVNITNYINKKIEIFQLYESEVLKNPLPRSIEKINALAKYRGSSIGEKYAEAFVLLKEITK